MLNTHYILLADLTSIDDIYTRVLNTCVYLSITAALIAGFKLYMKWNRGEDIEGGLLTWFWSLCLIPLVIKLVNVIVKQTDLSADWSARLLMNDAASVVVALGIAVSVIGLIRIYLKVRNGDDNIGEFLFKWLGSLIFLMSMYGIINAVVL